MSGQWHEETDVKDFNSDGFADTLTYINDGYGVDAFIVDGRSGEQFEMVYWSCKCAIKHVLEVPEALTKPENRPFLDALQEKLCPPFKDAPDPSLQWMLSAAEHHVRLDDHPYFDLVMDPKVPWTAGSLRLPDSYTITVKGEDLNRAYLSWERSETPAHMLQHGAPLIYRAHNHYRIPSGDSTKQVGQTATCSIIRTSHGLIAQRKSEHKWLFITDAGLNSGPEKLRWESIVKVQVVGEYALLQQSLTPIPGYALFIIHIESGKCARMKTLFSEDPTRPSDLGRFQVDGEQLQVFEDEEKVTYALPVLFDALKDVPVH